MKAKIIIIISLISFTGIFAQQAFNEAEAIKEAEAIMEKEQITSSIFKQQYIDALREEAKLKEEGFKKYPADNAFANSCYNVDFEKGDLSGWTGAVGYINNCCPTGGLIPGRHTVMSVADGNDPCGGFPVVAPGGQYSLRLGNINVGRRAERIQQTFTVDAFNSFFAYQYAVVLDDPVNMTHKPEERPYFYVVMFDQFGDTIPCSSYDVVVKKGNDGFTGVKCNGKDVEYQDWTTKVIDLSAYTGQDVTIIFETADCDLGAHFGYAYVDGFCSSSGLYQSNELCKGDTATLTGPSGAVTYSWDPTGDTTQSITITSPGVYTLSMTGFPGCSNPVMVHTVDEHPLPVSDFLADEVCLDDPTSFTDQSSTPSGSIVSWDWDFGDGTVSDQEDPSHTYTSAGTFDVELTVVTDKGCEHTYKKPIKVTPSPLAAFSGPNVCLGEETCFKDSTTISSSNVTYQWTLGNGTTSSIKTGPCITYDKVGNYNISLLVTDGNCSSAANKTVEVYPLPTADFSLSSDRVSAMNPVVEFEDLSNGAFTGTWHFGDGPDTALIPGQVISHRYPDDNVVGGQEFEVTLDIVNEYGCPDVISKPLIIDPYWSLFIPNAFTPNGDVNNETFYAKGLGILKYEMWIFDRWGNQVFHCKVDDLPQNEICHWDGVHQYGGGLIAQQDVFVWKMRFTDIFEKKHARVGHVSMVR